MFPEKENILFTWGLLATYWLRAGLWVSRRICKLAAELTVSIKVNKVTLLLIRGLQGTGVSSWTVSGAPDSGLKPGRHLLILPWWRWSWVYHHCCSWATTIKSSEAPEKSPSWSVTPKLTANQEVFSAAVWRWLFSIQCYEASLSQPKDFFKK